MKRKAAANSLKEGKIRFLIHAGQDGSAAALRQHQLCEKSVSVSNRDFSIKAIRCSYKKSSTFNFLLHKRPDTGACLLICRKSCAFSKQSIGIVHHFYSSILVKKLSIYIRNPNFP